MVRCGPSGGAAFLKPNKRRKKPNWRSFLTNTQSKSAPLLFRCWRGLCTIVRAHGIHEVRQFLIDEVIERLEPVRLLHALSRECHDHATRLLNAVLTFVAIGHCTLLGLS